MHHGRNLPRLLPYLGLAAAIFAGCRPRETVSRVKDDPDVAELRSVQMMELFNTSKAGAASMVQRFDATLLAPGFIPEATAAWITEHKGDLAFDIIQTPHRRIDQDQGFCGKTAATSHAELEISIPACAVNVRDSEDAARIIIHESVHHFGIVGDAGEEFADQVALGVAESWVRSGGQFRWTILPSENSPTQSFEPFGAYIPGRGSLAVVPRSKKVYEFNLQTKTWSHREWVTNENTLSACTAPYRNGYISTTLAGSIAGYPPGTAGMLDLTTGQQSTLPIMPVKLAHYDAKACGAYSDFFYVYGVKDADQKVIAARYDGTQWTSIDTSASPENVMQFAGVATKHGFFVTGGVPLAVPIHVPFEPYPDVPRSIEATVVCAESCRKLADLPESRIRHSLVTDGKDLVITWGGMNYLEEVVGTGFVYDFQTGAWEAMNPQGAPRARWGHSLHVADGKVIVFGGSASVDPFSDFTDFVLSDGAIYDLERKIWTPIEANFNVGGRLQPISGWTGKSFVFWGGKDEDDQSDAADGFVYTP